MLNLSAELGTLTSNNHIDVSSLLGVAADCLSDEAGHALPEASMPAGPEACMHSRAAVPTLHQAAAVASLLFQPRQHPRLQPSISKSSALADSRSARQQRAREAIAHTTTSE